MAIPLKDYPNGSEFDESLVPGYGSCVAFAKYVYDTNHSTYGAKISAGAAIMNLATGSWVQTYQNSSRHDFICGDKTNDGRYIYHVNWPWDSNPYTVRYEEWTTSKINSTFSVTGGYNN